MTDHFPSPFNNDAPYTFVDLDDTNVVVLDVDDYTAAVVSDSSFVSLTSSTSDNELSLTLDFTPKRARKLAKALKAAARRVEANR